MSTSPHIRLLTEADLEFADFIRELAGWNQLPGDWRRLLEHDPEGCFIAEWNGRPAGTATTTSYHDDLAWIGMVIVHPELRRHGIGRALLNHCIEHLQAKRLKSIKLDATPMGKSVYDTLGFRNEWLLARWEVDEVESVEPIAARESVETVDDVAAFLELDLESFGVDRSRMLSALAGQSATRIHRGPNGECDGFGMLRPGRNASYLGPVVATNDEAGMALVGALLGAAGKGRVFWDIPDDNVTALSLAKQCEFHQQRVLTRMYLGGNETPGAPANIWALAAPEIG